MGFLAFNQGYKSKLTQGYPVVLCAFFLVRLGVFAFFCKYSRRWRDRQ